MVKDMKELLLRSATKKKTDFLTGKIDDYLHLGGKELFAAAMDITPQIAAELLKTNTENRPLSANTVGGYARQMQDGWMLTGETIIVSKTGILLNGQHRCQACIDANVSFPCLVVFGIDEKAFAMIDHGKRRSHADIFAGYHVKNYASMAAASLWVWRYINTGGMHPNARVAPNSKELFRFYEEHEDLQKSVWAGVGISKYKLCPPSAMVAMHYLCSLKDKPQADIFFEKVITGMGGVKSNDPAIMLRNKLLATALSPTKHLSSVFISAYTILAWNATRLDKEVDFHWRTRQRPNAKFPQII